MGCLVMPFVLLGRFLKWSFTHGWKGFAVLGLILVVSGVGYCSYSNTITPADKPATNLDHEPTIQEAPYLVQTFARYFFANRVGKHGTKYTMVKYWELVGDKWRYFDRLTLDPKVVGEIQVTKRKEVEE
jgi:hypothetical protein